MTLTIHRLAFQRNDTYLFNELSFELRAGEMLQIRGENGCGKSTLLRILAGFIQPECGDIFWNGKNIFQTGDDYRQDIAWLGHQNGIKPYLTVYENLKLACALSNKKVPPEFLKTVLHAIKLSHVEKIQAMYLSAGQKRRLALARLQLVPARLWILDEPVTALDDQGQFLFHDLLKQHLVRGGFAIVATHSCLAINGMTKTLELGMRKIAHA